MIDLALIEVLISGVIIFLALIIFYPRAFLLLLLLFHWSQYIPTIGGRIETFKYSLGGINISGNDVVFAMFAVVIAISVLRFPQNFISVLEQPLGKIVLLFTGFQLVQMMWAFATGIPLDTVIRDSSNYLVCIYSFYLVLYYDRESFHRTLKYGYYLLLCLPTFEIFMLITGESGITSSGSERTYPISANIFFLLAIIYHLFQPHFNLKAIMVIVYMLAGMVMTQYRSAFVALIVILGITAAYFLRDGRMDRLLIGSMAILLILAIGFVGVSFVKPDYFTQTVTRYSDTVNIEDHNIGLRLYISSVAWEAFKQNPLFGVGFGHSIYVYTNDHNYITEQDWPPHNFIMGLLSKEGLVGTGMVLVILLISYQYLNKKNGRIIFGEQIRRQLLLFFLSLILIHLMNATFTFVKTNFVQWIFTGYLLLGVAEYKKAQSEREQEISV